MTRPLFLVPVVLLLAAAAAWAASLGDEEYRYLHDRFALSPNSELLRSMTPQEQGRLHDLIDDRAFRDRPNTRDWTVADFLYDAYVRQCSVWALSNTAPQCPPAANAASQPGKEIADRQCNACHLFGTAEAPAFFKLARAEALSAQQLTDALLHGHQMSPISLSASEVGALLVYIRSLK